MRKIKKISSILIVLIMSALATFAIAACDDDSTGEFPVPTNIAISTQGVVTWNSSGEATAGFTVSVNGIGNQVNSSPFSLVAPQHAQGLVEGNNDIRIRVNATETRPQSAWSEVESFVFTASQETTPFARPTITISSEGVVTWGSVEGATAGFTISVNDVETVVNASPFSLVYPQRAEGLTYGSNNIRVRVNATSARSQSAFSEVESFTLTQLTPFNAPTLMPTGGIFLEWSPITGAASYTVRLNTHYIISNDPMIADLRVYSAHFVAGVNTLAVRANATTQFAASPWSNEVTFDHVLSPIRVYINGPSELTAGAGIQNFTATVYPAEAAQGVTWSIVSQSAPGTAAIGAASGNVNPFAAGTITIRATATGTSIFADQAITIVHPNPEEVVIVEPLGGIMPNSTAQLSARVYPIQAQQGVTWGIENITQGDAVISADGYLEVTGNAAFTIVATSVSDDSIAGRLVVNHAHINMIRNENQLISLLTGGTTPITGIHMLTRDMDLGGQTFQGTRALHGIFSGGGFRIHNFTLSTVGSGASAGGGLFRWFGENAAIMDLTMEDFTKNSNYWNSAILGGNQQFGGMDREGSVLINNVALIGDVNINNGGNFGVIASNVTLLDITVRNSFFDITLTRAAGVTPNSNDNYNANGVAGLIGNVWGAPIVIISDTWVNFTHTTPLTESDIGDHGNGSGAIVSNFWGVSSLFLTNVFITTNFTSDTTRGYSIRGGGEGMPIFDNVFHIGNGSYGEAYWGWGACFDYVNWQAAANSLEYFATQSDYFTYDDGELKIFVNGRYWS
ncbi:MAG: hypothetical protein FWE22_05230 [Firmicutes bacterium]|nr:hypothetical protein [Bacillota bacterium]